MFREMNRYAPHQIYNSQIWINQDRAVAIMQATIQTRLPINEVQMQLNSDAKIVYGLLNKTILGISILWNAYMKRIA